MIDAGDEFSDGARKAAESALKALIARSLSGGRTPSGADAARRRRGKGGPGGGPSRGAAGAGRLEPEEGPEGLASVWFRTVEWDPDAEIIGAPLDRQGIPYRMTPERDGVRIEFHHESAPYVIALADGYFERGKLSPDRFEGLDELRNEAPRARGRVLETKVENPAAARIVRETLIESGVEFESWTSRSGEERFLVDEATLAARESIVEDSLERRASALSAPAEARHRTAKKAPPRAAAPEKTPAADRKHAIEASKALKERQVDLDRTMKR